MLGVEDDMGTLLDWMAGHEDFLQLAAEYYFEMDLERLERLIVIKKERGEPTDDLEAVYSWRVGQEEE